MCHYLYNDNLPAFTRSTVFINTICRNFHRSINPQAERSQSTEYSNNSRPDTFTITHVIILGRGGTTAPTAKHQQR